MKITVHIGIALLSACVLPATASASAADVPTAAPAGGTSLAAVQARAAKGDVAAEFEMGRRSYVGDGVPQSYTDAAAWARKAADQGDAKSQAALCFLYSSNKGLPVDYVQAKSWCEKAAAQGIAQAESTLGYFYHQGLGTQQDYALALSWFLKASQLGDAYAELSLGNMYGLGQGAPRDLQASRAWYSLASDQGNDDASLGLAHYYLGGIGVDKDVKHAIALIQKTVDHGNPTGEGMLAQLYETGNGVQKDMAQAQVLMRKAADAGLWSARAWLAAKHFGGAYPDLTDDLALQWLNGCPAGDLACLNDAAWFFATTPRKDLLDPAKAEKMVSQVLAQYPDDPSIMDTLAAAYAAEGKYQEAVAEEQKAMVPNPAFPVDDLEKARFVKHMAQYQSGRPYIDEGAQDY